jgi:hypothetical protein
MHVVCLAVVGVEKNISMFERSLNGVGVGASLSIDEADSVIYCVVLLALVWKTGVSRPAVINDSSSRLT